MIRLVFQKNKQGYVYVSFRESYWDDVRKKSTSRTVKNIGRLDKLLAEDPNIIEKLELEVEETRQKLEEEKTKLVEASLADARSALKQITETDVSKLPNRTLKLGSVVYYRLWKKLQIHKLLKDWQQENFSCRFDVAKTCFFMTTARLLMPDSKLGHWEARRGFLFGGDNILLTHMYRTLDFMHQRREQFMSYLNKRINTVYGRAVTVALYDVTTYSFESQDQDELRDFGFSKDNKVNQVQVVMGLLIDQNGIPISYELFPGNTNEFGMMVPILEKMQRDYGVKNVVVAADQGLNSTTNLLKIKELGMDYVIAYRLRGSGKKGLDLINSTDGWVKRGNQTREDVSKYKVTTETRKIRVAVRETVNGKEVVSYQSQTLTSNLLVNYSPARARKDAYDRERLINKAQRYTENPSLLKSDLRRGGKSYLKIDADGLVAEVDEKRIAENAAYDGYYGIVYSNADMSPDEVMRTHHSLWQIEESFRISKSLLHARPCFHWKPRRIEAHFFLCYMSLVLFRLLELELQQQGVQLTAQQIHDALTTAELVEMPMGNGQSYYATSNVSEDFLSISKAVGLDAIPHRGTSGEILRALKLRSLKVY